MTEANHYEPVPEQRPPWQAGFQPDGSTPERWFEPPQAPTPAAEDRPGPSRRLIAALLATSLIGAVLGGGATFLALRETGAFNAPAATAAVAINVSVQSESSAIIQAVAKVGPSVVTIVAQQATGETTGSGIVYDAAGWILTNKHVVASATGIDVLLKDGRSFTGSLYGVDTLTDLAIVKINGATGLSPASMGTSSELQVGQLAIAIGSPLGVGYSNSVTSGIVSALGRDITVTSDTGLAGGTQLNGLIQTDAAISAGNSGGPLVDDSGRVIGVTTTVADTAQGIGFAIPIDIAKPIMQQALAGTQAVAAVHRHQLRRPRPGRCREVQPAPEPWRLGPQGRLGRQLRRGRRSRRAGRPGGHQDRRHHHRRSRGRRSTRPIHSRTCSSSTPPAEPSASSSTAAAST